MAQHDYNLANGTGAAFRADANAALAAIQTTNSGAGEPSSVQPYMLWADTNAGQLKIRNGANNGWVVIGTLASANLGLVPAVGGTQANVGGSASAPSYSFQGDTDTGAFSALANVYAVATGGVQRHRTTAEGYFKASNTGAYFNNVGNFHEFNNAANDHVLVVHPLSNSYTSAALQIYTNRNTSNSSYNVISYFNIPGGNTRFSVNDAGTVSSVGTYNNTTANAANLVVDSFGGFQRSTSSARYKTDIRDVQEDQVNIVLSLRPIRYRSVADADNSDWSYYGLIAEEVAEQDPRLVHWGYRDEDYELVPTEESRFNEETGEVEVVEVSRQQLKDGAALKPEGVQYERVGVLTLALAQRHEARLAELEARLAALEAGASS